MIKKVLIANRGEIAIRVIRACRELNIATVAVYSSADRDSLHAKLADESICIGPPLSAKSYLSIPAIMSACEISGVDAVHPGYGFLSENSEFARVCEEYGIIFIGPTSEQIAKLGNKVEARALAEKSGVPMLPGSRGRISSVDEALSIAAEIGFPVILKASAGGGGRGMKIVHHKDNLAQMYHLASTEAGACFGNTDVFMERYCERPRHVEVQIIGDKHGNIVHLGERDCSIQRRHQKLIEEAPCPVMDEVLRKRIGETAVALARTVNYSSLGTVEFLMDEDHNFYFMEVNTRAQVEHPVTEEVSGMDLIKEQIHVANGGVLRISQDEVRLKGHALECRINAEDPVTFAPWPGKITDYHVPGGPGVRIDSMLYSGYTVPSNYDSLLAKLITYGRDREECLCRMRRALQELKIDGIRTNIDFHRRVLEHPHFQSGQVTTRFLESFLAEAKS